MEIIRWPNFILEWNGGADCRIGFTEVCGLDSETEVIEYREGNRKKYNSLISH